MNNENKKINSIGYGLKEVVSDLQSNEEISAEDLGKIGRDEVKKLDLGY